MWKRSGEVMNNWKEVTLGEVLQFQRGFDLLSKDRHQGNIPVISSSGVTGYHNKAKARFPGVIIGRKGTLGTVHYVASDYWPHDTTLWIKDFKGNLPKFIYYFLKLMHLESYDVGASNPTLNRNHLHKLKLKFPPLPVQKTIAAILSTYDDLIENNDRRITLLEKMAEEIYREWFVRLRFPGHEQVKTARLKARHIETVRLNEVCEFIIDCEHKTAPIQDTGYPSIRTPNIGKGRLFLENVNRVSEETYKIWTKRAMPQPGDLVLAREAPVGNVAIIPSNSKICLGQRTTLIRPEKSKIKPYYLLFLLLRSETQHNLLGLSNGATVHHLNMKDIRNLKLPIVHSIEIQEQFDSIVSKQHDLIATLTEQTQNLRQTRDRLLTRLISGKLSVEDLDIQFPPSMSKEDEYA
jgi:type I restriction enzyme, S subunit